MILPFLASKIQLLSNEVCYKVFFVWKLSAPTLQGGPVRLRPVRATPCDFLWCDWSVRYLDEYLSTLLRLKCSGVHLLDVSIRSRLVLFVLVTHLCCRYEQFETWGSTLMRMSPWALTSRQSSKRVLLHSVKYAACGVLWHVPPC